MRMNGDEARLSYETSIWGGINMQLYQLGIPFGSRLGARVLTKRAIENIPDLWKTPLSHCEKSLR